MLKIYLSVEGMERFAAGQSLYSWDYVVRNHDTPPSTGILIAEVQERLPTPESCIAPVLDKLIQDEAAAREELNETLFKLADRRQRLLALTNEVQAS